MSDITIYCYQEGKGLSSSVCLARSAAVYVGQSPEDAQKRWIIGKTEKGKPFLKNRPDVHCSVTHSGGYWLGAFSAEPVGIDLQVHKDGRLEALSRRFFHPAEDAYLKAKNYEDFFSVWAAKESVVKFTGEGIGGGFSRFSVVDSLGVLPRTDGLSLRFIPFREGFSLCVCAEQIAQVRILPGQ